MSDLADLTGEASRDGVLPGYVLSEPGLAEWGRAEVVFERQHLSHARRLAKGLPVELADRVLNRASDEVRDGKLAMLQPAFNAKATSARNFPLLLWLCLRVKHPQLTVPTVVDELRKGGAAVEQRVTEAVLGLWGYHKRRAGDPKPHAPPGDRSGGGTSSGSSEIAGDSPASRSAA